MIDVNAMKNSARSLAEKHHLRLVLLFGSQVSGRTHRESDVDIGVLAEKTLGFMESAKLELEFTRALKMARLQLVDLRTVPPLFLKHVALGSVLLYEREPREYHNFKIYALMQYFETRPLLRLRDQSIKEFLQQV